MSGCSPQGFVDSMAPTRGRGFFAFMRSMKMMPGSPVAWAFSTMRSKMSRARSVFTTAPERGLTRSYVPSARTASMKASVIATERLKFVNRLVSRLQLMNSRISG